MCGRLFLCQEPGQPEKYPDDGLYSLYYLSAESYMELIEHSDLFIAFCALQRVFFVHTLAVSQLPRELGKKVCANNEFTLNWRQDQTLIWSSLPLHATLHGSLLPDSVI